MPKMVCQIILFSGTQLNYQDNDALMLELFELTIETHWNSCRWNQLLVEEKPQAKKSTLRHQQYLHLRNLGDSDLGSLAASEVARFVWKIFFGIMIRTYRHTEHIWISMIFPNLLLRSHHFWKIKLTIPRDSLLEGGVVFALVGILFLHPDGIFFLHPDYLAPIFGQIWDVSELWTSFAIW